MNEFYAMLVQKDCVVALFRPGGAQYGLMLRLFRPGGLNTARARALCSLCSIRARFVGYVLTVVARIRRHAPVAASFGHSRNR